MLETIITSSLLIVIIIALRFLLRGKLSPVVIYALWATVALRLLVPVSLFDSRMSVMNLVDTQPASTFAADISNTSVPTVQHNESLPIPNDHSNTTGTTAPSSSEHHSHAPGTPNGLSARSEALVFLWIAGALCVLAVTMVRNERFYAKLKAVRKPLNISAPIPVFVASGIASPCIAGILRPCVYVNRFAAENEQRMRYVLAHELVHYRHLDHIWAAVRVLCVALHWFNPLVWFAAHLSRQDSELACDSAVISAVGDRYRIDYGRTLVDKVNVGVAPSDLVLTSTTMSSAGRSIKERINMIKSKPKTIIWAAVAAVAVITAAFIITFTGAESAAFAHDTGAAVSGTDAVSEDTPASEECPDLIAQYSTLFNAANVGRYNNIRISAQYIDGTVLQPGEEFSFNAVVGKRTEERGFVKATGYAFEDTAEDYGAGISQTATTLFNAAFGCGLEITEQRTHMYTVNYTTDANGGESFGNDATVAWGTCDLRFVNNKEHPVMIRMSCEDGEISAEIYGTEDGVRAKFAFFEVETVPYQTVYMPPAADAVRQNGQMGRTIDVWRIVYENGIEVDRKQAYSAVYMPMMNIVYTDDLPQGCEYYEPYYMDYGADEGYAVSPFPEGVSSETIWSDQEVAYLLKDTPEFTGGECRSSVHYIEGTVYHQVLADYTAKTDILELTFRNIESGYVQKYIDLLTEYGFTYFADDKDTYGSMYIAYNAPSHGIGVQIQGYRPGEDPRNIIISFFRQGDGCFGMSEPVPKG